MNELKQIFRRAIFVMLSMILLVAVTACKQDEEDEEEQLVTRYSYNLTSNDSYYIVAAYNCVDNGDNTYSAKNYAMHYFYKASSSFKDKSGAKLIYFVRNGIYAPSASKSYTRDTSTKITVNSSNDTKIYYELPEGISYTVYWYS